MIVKNLDRIEEIIYKDIVGEEKDLFTPEFQFDVFCAIKKIVQIIKEEE